MRNCKYCLLLLSCIFLVDAASAQGGKDSLTMAMLVPKQAVKFSPLHLINFYPTLEFSFEQKIASKVTLQLEGGYVLDYDNDTNDSFLNKRGAKVKLEARYYFFGRTDKRKIYYIAGEGYANIINFDRTTSTQECFDVNCENIFIRFQDAKMAYREKGFTIKAGLIKYAGEHFFFDFSSGWTIRNIEYRELTNVLADDNDDVWDFLDIPNEDDRIALSPNVGARVGYRFR